MENILVRILPGCSPWTDRLRYWPRIVRIPPPERRARAHAVPEGGLAALTWFLTPLVVEEGWQPSFHDGRLPSLLCFAARGVCTRYPNTRDKIPMCPNLLQRHHYRLTFSSKSSPTFPRSVALRSFSPRRITH